MTKKHNIFGELMEGVAAMTAHRDGKITLRSHRSPCEEEQKIRVQAGIRRFRGKLNALKDLGARS